MARNVPALVLVRSTSSVREERSLSPAGLRVSRGQLHAGARRFSLEELQGVDLEHLAPRWVVMPLLAAFATMMVGLPFLQSRLASAPVGHVPLLVGALVASALFFFV